ncbi:methyltransferase [Salinarimonas soli]|uniref:Methyltransferase domain-containing protein n=1 Tax=Salinarimonas soli TaxID=1638099 RepID=A0A5B2VTH6_9HYPH|nr:methyltransferase [Salinarimonas soli]KAA2242064.1 methyltransferase domain-containing protein [Salinarimonas soli]
MAPLPPVRVTSGDPNADRRFAYAQGALDDGDHEAAADLAEQTLEITPDFAPAHALLGRARAASGQREAAIGAFQAALALDPEDPLGVRLELACLGALPQGEALGPGYVRALFDQYAPRFDAHLVGALGYRGPAVLMEALDAVAPGRSFDRALDLGCGTGLMGEVLRARAGHLAGCDLSPAMVEAARGKGIYDRLAAAELVAFLAAEPRAGADLVVAADVLVYVGDIAPVLAAAAGALMPGGLFGFTVQDHQAEGFALGEDARFAHAPAYLDAAARAAGFEVALSRAASTRRDRGADVPGRVLVLRRP